MNLHRPRASRVSVAHLLNYKSCRAKMQGFSGEELLQKMQQLGCVRFSKFPVLPQEIYPYIQSPSLASSILHTDYLDTYK